MSRTGTCAGSSPCCVPRAQNRAVTHWHLALQVPAPETVGRSPQQGRDSLEAGVVATCSNVGKRVCPVPCVPEKAGGCQASVRGTCCPGALCQWKDPQRRSHRAEPGLYTGTTLEHSLVSHYSQAFVVFQGCPFTVTSVSKDLSLVPYRTNNYSIWRAGVGAWGGAGQD